MRFLALDTTQIIQTLETAAETWDKGGNGTGTFTEGAPLSSDGGSSITHRACNCLWDDDLVDTQHIIETFASTPAMTVYRCQNRLGNGVVEKANVLGADAVEWNEIGEGDFVEIALQDAGLVRYETQTIGGVAEWEPSVEYEVGDQASYNETVYECIQAHTSQEGWEPPNVPSLWREA